MTRSNQFIFKLVVIILFLSGTTESYAQGPWSPAKGSGFAQVQAIPSAYRYSGLLVGGLRDVQPINRETWNADYGIYGQYSLTDKLQITGYLPFKHVSTGALTDSLYFDNLLSEGSLVGVGNVHLALKYGILSERLNLAVSIQTNLNTAAFDLEKGLATGYPATSVGLFVHAGGGISEKSYAFIDIGFLNYNNEYSNVIQSRVEYGYRVKQSLYLIAGLDVRHSLQNGSYYNENLIQTGLSPNNQEWAVINVKLNYETKNGVGFNFGMPLIPFKIVNVGFTGSFAFGVYKKWDNG